MLSRIMQVAIFMLVTWLTFQQTQAGIQISRLEGLTSNQQKVLDTALISSQEANEAKLDELGQKVTAIVEAQKKNEDNKKKLQAYKAEQEKLNTLRKAYILVLEAETARIGKDAKTAQARLKASKSLIWKSGSNFSEHKKALQGLMGPIDGALGSWKKGNLKKGTKKIYSVIGEVLKKQDK